MGSFEATVHVAPVGDATVSRPDLVELFDRQALDPVVFKTTTVTSAATGIDKGDTGLFTGGNFVLFDNTAGVRNLRFTGAASAETAARPAKPTVTARRG